MSPSISIIVPVYKAEAYLHRCVDSLLAQTFTDFEVLLIDDGSPDRSGEICDDYAHKDARVRVFHQPNGGVSVARQRGLDEALGEYTIHADPDDRVEPDMLEELYRKAKEDDADMVICDYYYEVGRTQSVIRQKETGHSARSVLKDIFRMNVSACFWNKLIRRQVYCVNDVRLLPKMNIGEDYYAVARLLTKIKNVSFVHRPLYHYIKNEKPYLISWNKSRIDSPIYDLLSFYKNHYLDFDFDDLFHFYESGYPLKEDERLLLFTYMAIPYKIEIISDEYEMCIKINKMIEYLYKTSNLIMNYHS